MKANLLTVAWLRSEAGKAPGKYSDGNGLVLHVVTPERRLWFYRYMLAGKERLMGLGSADHVTLAQARERADAARRLKAQGIDPLGHRDEQRAAAETKRALGTTFREAAEQYVAAHEAGWRNAVHRQQWRSTLATYADPVIGGMPISTITRNDVLAVLAPIWQAKPETASRLRGRIEVILDYAKVRGWRDGENPALWRGNLSHALMARAKVRAVEHHAALDWREAPAFMVDLDRQAGMGAKALAFAILTGVRSGEVRGARWDEVDFDSATWTIPGARMKAGRQHRVPLSEPALAILHELAKLKDGSGLVFFGRKRDAALSNMSLTAVLRRMKRGDLTAHGFRSAFRDWAAECTSYQNHVVELALAHAIGDKVEAAYRRGDLFDKRRQLMDDWAAYLSGEPAKVVQNELQPSPNPLLADIRQRLRHWDTAKLADDWRALPELPQCATGTRQLHDWGLGWKPIGGQYSKPIDIYEFGCCDICHGFRCSSR